MINVIKLKNKAPLFIINLGKLPPACRQEEFLQRIDKQINEKLKVWCPEALTLLHFENIDITIVDREPI